MNYYAALRLVALKAIMKPDADANLRHIFRWYSHQFHTPLHQVDELPFEDVLCAFYEHTYENMSDEDRDSELADLTETDEERFQRERKKDEEAAENFEFTRFTEEQEKKKKKEQSLKSPADVKPDKKQGFMTKGLPEPTLPKIDKKVDPSEEVQMVFVDEDDFEKEIEQEAMMPYSRPQSFDKNKK